ncbi:MAG TPA: response regulator transcription factor [Gaiellaceae bacterium]|nr:response regulator transcription factor [Gaiellaceae bacterium]
MSQCRILVADPLAIFRASVRALLSREGEFVVSEAADLDEVLAQAAAEPPDIALIDHDLPPAGGVEAVRRLREAVGCRTVVWSLEPTREGILCAVNAGAHGYLHKAISTHGLVRSMYAAAAGETPLTRSLTTKMIDALHEFEERRRTRDVAAELSARQRQVLELLARGARNKEIATALSISEFTAKRHVQNILHKLNVPSRRDASRLYSSSLRRDEPSLTPAAGSAA